MRAPQLPEAPPIALVFLGLANLPHEAETLELNAGNQSTSLLSLAAAHHNRLLHEPRCQQERNRQPPGKRPFYATPALRTTGQHSTSKPTVRPAERRGIALLIMSCRGSLHTAAARDPRKPQSAHRRASAPLGEYAKMRGCLLRSIRSRHGLGASFPKAAPSHA